MDRELVANFFISETKRATNMRPEMQSKNRVDFNYRKTFGLGPSLTKALWKSNISLCLSQK